MSVTVLILREDWADPAIPLPAYATAGAAGADIRANLPEDQRAEGLTLSPMQRLLVPTGLRLQIPPGHEVQVRPRSGLSLRHGLTLPNTPGTIDSDYRGPVGVPMINLSDTPYTIRHGERIAQIVVAPVVQAAFAPIDRLEDTERGSGGFGSTGRD